MQKHSISIIRNIIERVSAKKSLLKLSRIAAAAALAAAAVFVLPCRTNAAQVDNDKDVIDADTDDKSCMDMGPGNSLYISKLENHVPDSVLSEIRDAFYEDSSIISDMAILSIKSSNNVEYYNTPMVPTTASAEALEKAIQNFEEKGHKISFVMADVFTGEVVCYRPMERYYSASAIKGPYVISLLEDNVEPDKNMFLTIRESSNEAYVALREEYGAETFCSWLEDAFVLPERGEKLYTFISAKELALMWSKAYNCFVGEEDHSDWARKTFMASSLSDISNVLGEKYTTYSKAGWISAEDTVDKDERLNVYTNGGIVMQDTRPYILVTVSYNPGMEGMEDTMELDAALDSIHREMVLYDKRSGRY